MGARLGRAMGVGNSIPLVASGPLTIFNSAKSLFRRLGPTRLTIVCATLLSAFVIVSSAFLLIDLRSRALAENERNLANTALIVSKQIEHIFATVGAVQREILADVALYRYSDAKDTESNLSNYKFYLDLRDKAVGMPYVGSLTVINRKGRMVNFSRQWPVPDIDVSDREFFKAFQADQNISSYIGEPIRNRASGSWVIQFARKIPGQNGAFMGLTTAAIELQYLQDNFRQISLQPGSGIALLRTDGTLFARTPKTVTEIERRFPDALSLKLVATSEQGVGLSAGAFDGTPRIIASHRVGNYPLVIAATKSVEMALADWKRTSEYFIFITVLTVLAIAAFAALFVKLFGNYRALSKARTERETAQKLQAQSMQFEVALNNMSQGVVMLDPAAKVVVCNERYIQMYGLSSEFVKSGLSFLDLMKHRHESGTFKSDPDDYCLQIRSEIARQLPTTRRVEIADGRTIQVVNQPRPDGGWVSTHEDVTDKIHSEKLNELQKYQLDAALENMSQGLCMFDAAQRLVICNQQYSELYGLDEEDTKLGTSLRTILEHRIAAGAAPHDVQKYIDERLAEVTANKPYQVTNQLEDGRFVFVVHRPLPDGGWVATHEDVTEAKSREESFRLLFDENPVPIFIFELENFRFLAVNDAAVAHYGYTRERFLQMTALEIQPQEERAGLRNRLLEPIENKDPSNSRTHVKADGSRIQVVAYGRNLRYQGSNARLVAVHDVTRAKLAETELRRTKQFVDAVIEHVPLPILVKDVTGLDDDARDSRFTLFNRAYEELTGDLRAELIGKTAHQIYPKERADLIVRSDNEALQSDQVVLTIEHPILTTHNGTRLVVAKKTVIRDDNGKAQHILTVVDDVTERRSSERQIAYLAHTDSLTDLPNRATFVDRLAASLDEASKSGERFAVLCLDLDHFKEANDVYGHQVGDGLLREAARRLQAAAGIEFLARVGGDEFTLIVKNGAQPAAAETICERLLAAFNDEFEIDGHKLTLGVSIGGAIYPVDGVDAETLLTNADAALYQAKAETRGSARFFAVQLGTRLRERRELLKALEGAVANNEFVLHYQPQGTFETNEIFGFESLVRWQCPKRGLVPPGSFISVAEESDLIIPLGEWVLRESCREAASWPKPLTIAVNISPVQFHHGDLPNLVHSILLETGLAPSRLELEITEGVLIDDFSRAVSILRKLKSLGVRIAMDDFGSGYSSLSYLHSFPFDKIKIDRSFIGDLEHNHHSKAIVRAIITLGHSLDVPVLAEGVETEAQRLFLLKEGCDDVQGYLFGRPLPIDNYAHLVSGHKNIELDNVSVV